MYLSWQYLVVQERYRLQAVVANLVRRPYQQIDDLRYLRVDLLFYPEELRLRAPVARDILLEVQDNRAPARLLLEGLYVNQLLLFALLDENLLI